MQNGRSTWAELAAMLNMSPPGVADRVRRLEESGVITGFSAQVDPATVGLTLTAFVQVTLERPSARLPFLALVASLPEILAGYHIAGSYDYLLLIRCRDTAALESLLTDQLKSMEGVAQTNTTIVLSTVKETAVLPI